MKIFHYTTIDSLALILKNRTLRFNCLKNVDDPNEGTTEDFGSMAGYVFVSCWTDNEEENLALWTIYSKSGRGIRIEVDSLDIHFEFPDSLPKYVNDIVVNARCSVDGSFFIVYPEHDEITGNLEYFYRVHYSNDNRQFFLPTSPSSGRYDLTAIARTKKTHWVFQKEVRFVMLGCTNKKDQHLSWQGIFNNITEKIPFDCNHVDLALSDTFFENMKIRRGPLSGVSDQIVLESLLSKYCPRNTNAIEESRIEIRDVGQK